MIGVSSLRGWGCRPEATHAALRAHEGSCRHCYQSRDVGTPHYDSFVVYFFYVVNIKFGGFDLSPAPIGLNFSVFGARVAPFHLRSFRTSSDALARGMSSFLVSLRVLRSTSSSLSKP